MDTHSLAIRLVKLWYHFTGIFFVIAAALMFQSQIYLLFVVFLLLAIERLGNMRDLITKAKDEKPQKIPEENE